MNGPYHLHLLARIYLLAGEREKALDVLEGLRSRPYFLSPGWLRIDPTFAPLNGHPRFEKLAAGRRRFPVRRRFTKHLPVAILGWIRSGCSLIRGFTR